MNNLTNITNVTLLMLTEFQLRRNCGNIFVKDEKYYDLLTEYFHGKRTPNFHVNIRLCLTKKKNKIKKQDF